MKREKPCLEQIMFSLDAVLLSGDL
jgi:hypothetical protein